MPTHSRDIQVSAYHRRRTPNRTVSPLPGRRDVRGGAPPIHSFKLHPAVERFLVVNVAQVQLDANFRPKYVAVPKGTRAPTETDSALRRKLQHPLRTVMEDPNRQYESVPTSAPLYKRPCGRCAQRHMGAHDKQRCKGERDTTGLFCLRCLGVFIFQDDLVKHMQTCFTAKLTTSLLAASAFNNGSPVRTEECTVEGCSWRSHIYGMWCAHVILHRYVVLRYGPVMCQRTIFLGNLTAWGYVRANNVTVPPLCIERLIGCTFDFVKASDTSYEWEWGLCYNFSKLWPNQQRSKVTTLPNFDSVLPFLGDFSFLDIANAYKSEVEDMLELRREDRERTARQEAKEARRQAGDEGNTQLGSDGEQSAVARRTSVSPPPYTVVKPTDTQSHRPVTTTGSDSTRGTSERTTLPGTPASDSDSAGGSADGVLHAMASLSAPKEPSDDLLRRIKHTRLPDDDDLTGSDSGALRIDEAVLPSPSKRPRSSDEESEDEGSLKMEESVSVASEGVKSTVSMLSDTASPWSPRTEAVADPLAQATAMTLLPEGQRLRSWGEQSRFFPDDAVARREGFSNCRVLLAAAYPAFTGPLRHTLEMRTVKHVSVYGLLIPGENQILFGVNATADGYFAPAQQPLPAKYANASTIVWLQSTAAPKNFAGMLAVDALLGYYDRIIVKSNMCWALIVDCH